MNNKVAIVGGGLAGLTAALELSKRGFEIDIYESTSRLGGKAGSDYGINDELQIFNKKGLLDRNLSLPKGVGSDHGYHVFPVWYENMRDLWEQIGLGSEELYEGYKYQDLPEAIDQVRQPFADEPRPSIQQMLSICDLVLQQDEVVDKLTLEAFLYSRDYFRIDNPTSLNDFVLNALTIGDEDISSRVIRNVFRQWLPVFHKPNWIGLRGSLDRVLIKRIEKTIELANVRIHFNHRLVDLQIEEGTAEIKIEGPDRKSKVIDCNAIVLAIPQEVLRKFANNALFSKLPQISKLHHLRSNPFTALDVFFSERLEDMPEGHFTLKGSEFGITGFEISQHWQELNNYQGSVIQFVVSNAKALRGLDGAGFVAEMIKMLQQYFPEMSEKVAFFVPHLNMDVPLYVNDVGTWDYRPKTDTAYRNLFFAGDFTQNDTDVTSMEGAVRSGRNAAEALRKKWACDEEEVHIKPTTPMPIELLKLIELAKVDPVTARFGCSAWLKNLGLEAQLDAE